MMGDKDKMADEWINEFKNCYQIEYDKVIHNQIHPKNGAIKMAEVMDMVSTKTKGSRIRKSLMSMLKLGSIWIVSLLGLSVSSSFELQAQEKADEMTRII